MIYQILKPLEKHRIKKVSDCIDGNNLFVLDIGCGDGEFLYTNRRKWKYVVGIDMNQDVLNFAKKRRYGVPAKFLKIDLNQGFIPLTSSYFHLVVSIATLQYISNINKLFQEIFRLLKRDGQFILEVPNITFILRRFSFLLGRLPNSSYLKDDWEDGVVRYFSLSKLKDYLRNNGFLIEKICCSGIFDNLRSLYPSLFGSDLIFVCRKKK